MYCTCNQGELPGNSQEFKTSNSYAEKLSYKTNQLQYHSTYVKVSASKLTHDERLVQTYCSTVFSASNTNTIRSALALFNHLRKSANTITFIFVENRVRLLKARFLRFL